MLRRFSFRCRSFRPRRSASLPAHRRPRDDCTYETLELEKGKSSFGSALHPDCGCGDRVGVRSAAHWNAGGILGGDCHTCSDAIDPGRNAHVVHRAHRRQRIGRIARSS